jgi:hypothetical protein
MKAQKTRVVLQGGLGNQLFQYFAGLYVSEIQRSKLEIDLSGLSLHKTLRSPEILSFVLPEDVQILNRNQTKLGGFLNKFRSRLRRRLQLVRALEHSVFGVFESRKLGFIEGLGSGRWKRRILGYFQTDKYFNYLAPNLRELNLRSCSDWFVKMSSLAESEMPIIVHIRRGDYLGLKDTYGVLSPQYYLDAMLELNRLGVNSKFWIFSDSVDIKDEFSRIFPPDTRWIVPPMDLPDAESLILMSRGIAIITANSTFSWWAATLNPNKILAIAPNPWFRNYEAPEDLVPESWIKVKSYWS